MARVKTIKTNFTAGELSPELIGRGDLSAYENGAAKLRNVRVIPTGGIRRRAGLRHIANALGGGRLIAFEFNTEQVYLLALSNLKIAVYADDSEVVTIDAPWTEEQLRQVNWTQSADTLLLVHPDVPPKRLTRSSASVWTLADWVFHENSGRINQPHFKFASDDLTLTPSGTSGSISVTASGDVFVQGHVGVRFRIADREIEITAVADARNASADVLETLAATGAEKDWEEASFSPVRGYPVSCTFHQDRLVIGGSRDLTNRLWLSRSADLFNFDLGDAEDDEAIEFAILSDQVNAVRAVFSGRHLQVFTSGAEWMVSGDPLTPSNIQLNRQTRIGSPVDRTIPPNDVDGATLFVSRSGSELREFLFADVEQAYQSTDLAVLSEDMLRSPVDQDFHKTDRILYVVNSDGTMASVTVFRRESVNAWTLFETDGAVRSVAAVGEEIYCLVERDASFRIEKLDSDVQTDAGITASVGFEELPKTEWNGFGHLDGRTVDIVADGVVRDPVEVIAGKIILSQPATNLQAGLRFTHVVEPLPVFHIPGGGVAQGAAVRLVKATFRLFQTQALRVDVGQGLRPLPFKTLGPEALDSPITPITGDKTVRALGWTRGDPKPLWRIEQHDPLSSTILSVLAEISVNG